MKVTAEKLPQSKVLLRIEIPPEQVEEAIERTYRDISRRVRVPGFRPGKAPRALVERYVGGPTTIQEEGIERLIEDAFRKALREVDVHPIGEPDLSERPAFHPGEPLVFEAAVPVAPTVELGDYQSIRMQPVAVEATPQQVNEYIDQLLEANAEWTPVERAAREGDHVVIDVKGIVGSVPTLYGPGGETLLRSPGGREVYNVEKHEHLINPHGPPEFAPGFDEELIGLLPGSEKTFGLTLPVDFPDPALANQSIVFTVKVHEVKEKHRPELNDEFAKAIGGGETVEELRENVRKRIQARLEYEARRAYEDALLDAVIERSTIELPDVLIERQIDAQIEDLKADLAREKIRWEDYLTLARTTPEQIRVEIRDSAIRHLKSALVLRAIAERENIVVTPEDVQAEIDATAAQFGPAQKIVRDRLSTRDQREQVELRLGYRKTIDRLIEIAQQPPVEAAVATEETGPAATERDEERAAAAVADQTAASPLTSGSAEPLPEGTAESSQAPGA